MRDMIAESLKAAYPHYKFVAVDVATIRATDPDKGVRYVWLTPRTIQKMIVEYDQGNKPKPLKSVRLQRGMEIASGRVNTGHKKKPGKKAVLVKRGHSVPIVRGGKSPPKASGARRAFGLRSMG